MTRLDETLQQLKDEYSPDAQAQRRVHAALLSSLANAPEAAAPSDGAVAGASKAGGLVVAGKVAAVVGVGAALTLGLLQLTPRRHITPPQEAPIATAPAVPTAASSVAQAAEPVHKTPTLTDAAAAAPESAEPIPHADGPVGKRVAARKDRERHRDDLQPAEPEALLRELQLVKAASQALRAGRTDDARHALLEHQRLFPSGQLSSERRALMLLLSCQTSPSAATRTAAQRFITQQPNSPLAQKLRKSCLD